MQAFSQAGSFALLLQHDVMVRAATATIAKNTFFMLTLIFKFYKYGLCMDAKVQTFLILQCHGTLYFEKNV